VHKDLVLAFEKMIQILKEDMRCKGGWHFGSVGREQSDIYSDYDPVFLVADNDFEDFAAGVPKIMAEISDELLICWAEGFNSNSFKNFCCAIRIGCNIHQLDFFIINNDYQDDWMCKLHCKGCTRENIIFDRAGEVTLLLDKGYSAENHIPNTVRAIDTYWFHVVMLIKYFKRGDIFKLIKNIDILFHAHVDLLLSRYDTLDWGGWESKVKHCVPMEKQEHLKVYFTLADLNALESAIKKGIILFKNDAEEICEDKRIDYSKLIPQQIISHFNKEISLND
jgi:hypothetical protein